MTTTAGDRELRIPKLRAGSCSPACSNAAGGWTGVFAVVMEACLHGVSTRKVDDLVKALGADTGMGKSDHQDLRESR